jgi:hypothetical protein
VLKTKLTNSYILVCDVISIHPFPIISISIHMYILVLVLSNTADNGKLVLQVNHTHTSNSNHILRLVYWAERGLVGSRRFCGRCTVQDPSSIASASKATTSSSPMAATVLLDSGETSERPLRSPNIYVYFFGTGPSQRGIARTLYALPSSASASCTGM